MAVMERIRLRALEPEDLEWLYRVENDETIWKWGNTNVPYSRYALKKYIAESRHDIYADGQLRLAAVMSDGRVVGCADLVNFSPRHLRAEVGILVFPEHWGKGYGAALLQLLVEYSRTQLYLHQLYAVVSARNIRACRTFEKADFGLSAVLPDWLREGRGEYVPAKVFCRRL